MTRSWLSASLLILGSVVAVGALRIGERGGALASTCECLDYASVYESGKAQCGMGLELMRLAVKPEMLFPDAAAFAKECLPTVSRAADLGSLWRAVQNEGTCSWKTLSKMDVEDCNDFPGIQNSSFYKHQRHSYCMKASQYADASSYLHTASWCYVSSECQSLNGGARINDQVSWKACVEGQDKMLADLSVPDLCRLEDMLHPAGALYGGCQLAAFKAYPMVQSARQQAKASSDRPTYFKDEKKDAAVVRQAGQRWEVYGDLRDGSDFKCVSGC